MNQLLHHRTLLLYITLYIQYKLQLFEIQMKHADVNIVESTSALRCAVRKTMSS